MILYLLELKNAAQSKCIFMKLHNWLVNSARIICQIQNKSNSKMD